MSPERTDRIAMLLLVGVAAAIPALIVVRHLLGWDPLAGLPAGARSGMAAVGWVFGVLGLLTCAVNVHLAVVAPWLERRAGGADEPGGPSGLPLVGSLLLGAAALLVAPSPPVGVALLALYLVDGYGLPRAAVSALRDS